MNHHIVIKRSNECLLVLGVYLFKILDEYHSTFLKAVNFYHHTFSLSIPKYCKILFQCINSKQHQMKIKVEFYRCYFLTNRNENSHHKGNVVTAFLTYDLKLP